MAKQKLLLLRGAALVAVALCAWLSCSGTPIAPLVRLRLSGIPDGAERAVLTVTIQGKTQMTEFTDSSSFDTITVGFPAGTTGDATFSVLIYQGSCLIGSGSGSLTLASDEGRELPITLAKPSVACGTPAGKVIVQVVRGTGSMGSVTSTEPAGISCGSDCEEVYPIGTTVTLRAEASAGSFLGWAGACSDTNDCTVSVAKEGNIIVQAIFGTRPCKGWCDESPAGITDNLFGVFGTGPLNVVTVGQNGLILHWDGQSWTPQASTDTQTLRAVTLPRGGSSFIAVGDGGTILTQSGGSWSKVTSPAGSTRLSGVSGLSPSSVFIVGDGETLVKGNFQSTPPSLSVVAASSLQGSPDAANLAAVSAALTRDEAAFVGASGYNARRSVYISERFDDEAAGNPQNLNAVFYGTNYIFAAGASGTLLRRGPPSTFPGLPDNWPDWTVQSSPAGAINLNGMWGMSDSAIYAVGDSRTILYWDGSVWTQVPLPASLPSRRLNAIWGTGPNNIYAVGNNGTILHYLP